MNVRRLAPEDAALARSALCDIKLRASPLECPILPSTLARWLSRDDHVLVVASQGDRPLGFALGYFLDRVDGDDRMLFFHETEVAETERRRGVGRRLVEEIKRIAWRARARKLWVETETDNVAARALYGATGGRRAESSSTLFFWSQDDLATEIEGEGV